MSSPNPQKVRLLYIPILIHTTMIWYKMYAYHSTSVVYQSHIFWEALPSPPPKPLKPFFFIPNKPFLLNGTGPGVATCSSRLGIESHSPRLGWRLGGECHCRKPRGSVGGRGLSNLCGVDEELATRALDFFYLWWDWFLNIYIYNMKSLVIH